MATNLKKLAKLIANEVRLGESFSRKGVEHFRQAGVWLIEAKSGLKHGAWLPWLEKEVGLSARQAQKYMQLSKCAPGAHLEEYWEILCGRGEPEIEHSVHKVSAFGGTGYRVVYADPPWEYNDSRTGTKESGAAKAQYPSMPLDEICALKDPEGKSVKDICQPNAALFLWATAPCLPEAMQVIPAWGFEYKAHFVWDKVRGYNGHYNDVQHELLLIGIRGSCQPQEGPLRKSIVRVEKTKHSRKPEIFYEIVEAMYSEPRIELFARKVRDGWDTWGNQCRSTQPMTEISNGVLPMNASLRAS